MKNNNVLIAHPNSEDEMSVIKAFFNALNIKFEIAEESPYNSKFVEKIKKIQKSTNRTEVNPEDLWGSIGLQ
jgi:hypothetical protein